MDTEKDPQDAPSTAAQHFQSALHKISMANALMSEGPIRKGRPCFFAADPNQPDLVTKWKVATIVDVDAPERSSAPPEAAPPEVKDGSPSTDSAAAGAGYHKVSILLETGEKIATSAGPSHFHANKTAGWELPSSASNGTLSSPLIEVPDLTTVADDHESTLSVSLRRAMQCQGPGVLLLAGKEGAFIPWPTAFNAYLAAMEQNRKGRPAIADDGGNALEASTVLLLGTTAPFSACSIVPGLMRAKINGVAQTPPSTVLANFQDSWRSVQRILSYFLGSTPAALELTLHAQGELSFRFYLADAVGLPRRLDSNQTSLPADVVSALSSCGTPTNAIDSINSLLQGLVALQKLQLPIGTLKTETQEQLDKIATKLGISPKTISSFFYSKTTMNAVQLEESRTGALAVYSSKLLNLVWSKNVTPSSPVLQRVIVLPKTSSSGSSDIVSDSLEEFLLTLAKDHALCAMRKSSRRQESNPDSSAVSASGPEPERNAFRLGSEVLQKQLAGLEGLLSVLDSQSGATPEATIAKLVEAATKGTVPLAAIASFASSTPTVLSSTPTTGTSVGPTAAAAGTSRPGKLNLGNFGAQSASPASATPAPGPGKLGAQGVTKAGGASPSPSAPAMVEPKPTPMAPALKGSNKDRDVLSVLHPSRSNGGMPVKYRITPWLAILKAFQTLPQAPPTPLAEYGSFVTRYYGSVYQSSTGSQSNPPRYPFASTVIAFGSGDSSVSSQETGLAMELLRRNFHALCINRKVADFSAFETLVPASQRPELTPLDRVKVLLSALPIASHHFALSPSSGGTVELTVRAWDTIRRRFEKFKGPPLSLMQAFVGALVQSRRVVKMNLLKRLTQIQQVLRWRNANQLRLQRQQLLVQALTFELFSAQKTRIQFKERGTRDFIENEERAGVAFIMKQAGSFLGPLNQRVRQDMILLERKRRLEIREAEILRLRQLLEWRDDGIATFAEERLRLHDQRRRLLLRVTEPFGVNESLKRATIEGEERTSRQRILQFAADELILRRNEEKHRLLLAKRRAEAEMVVASRLAVAASQKSRLELQTVQVLARPKQPYDVDYSQYWGSPSKSPTVGSAGLAYSPLIGAISPSVSRSSIGGSSLQTSPVSLRDRRLPSTPRRTDPHALLRSYTTEDGKSFQCGAI
jgi:hypothetical protein